MSDNREPEDLIIEEYDRMSYEDHKESEVNDLTIYFKSAFDVKEQTVNEHKNAIYEAKEIANEHWNYYYALDKEGCDTLSMIIPDLNQDIRASIFLSMHGLYRPANSLLRRWLDTTIYAIYFDYEFKKNGSDKNETINKYNEWLNGDKPEAFHTILRLVINDNLLNEVVINEKTYLFSWNEIPGDDSDRLINFLKENYGFDWITKEKTEKLKDGKTIILSNEQKSISLKLNTERTEVNLKIDDGKKCKVITKFIAKTVNGKLNIYISFRDIIYKIFQDLSKYVHYGGIINPADLKLTLSEYNKEHFEKWFEKLNQINEICYILILSKFPNLKSEDKRSFFYFPKRMKKLKELLGV